MFETSRSLFNHVNYFISPFNRLWAQITIGKFNKMANSIAKEVSHIPKFNGSNFASWRFGLDMLLEQHKLQGIVYGTDSIPVGVNTTSNFVKAQSELMLRFQRHKNLQITVRAKVHASLNQLQSMSYYFSSSISLFELFQILSYSLRV